MVKSMKILYFGDIIGKKGIRGLKAFLEEYRKKDEADFIFANGENLAGGKGITRKHFQEIRDLGVDGVSTGNHVFDKREIYSQLKELPEVVRPLNYPAGTPGKGWHVFRKNGFSVAVVNLSGRVFMKPLDCPFRRGLEIVSQLQEECSAILVDFHAEATSEKKALGYFLDGKATAVLGTHTHTQTNDGQYLPKKTFFLTDLGMVGARDSILGVKKDNILNHFLTGLPFAVEVAEEGAVNVNGIELQIDETGKVTDYRLINLDIA